MPRIPVSSRLTSEPVQIAVTVPVLCGNSPSAGPNVGQASALQARSGNPSWFVSWIMQWNKCAAQILSFYQPAAEKRSRSTLATSKVSRAKNIYVNIALSLVPCSFVLTVCRTSKSNVTAGVRTVVCVRGRPRKSHCRGTINVPWFRRRLPELQYRSLTSLMETNGPWH